MADWRFRLKRAGFGATMKNSNGFALKNSSDADSITVGVSPTTLNTKARIAGAVKALARLAQ
jgi:hypothetical protein